jgi:hypothetical protein
MEGGIWQRFALQAMSLGLKTAFMNQRVEVAMVRPDLTVLIGMPGCRPVFVMHFGLGAFMPFLRRRPLDPVLI